MFYQNIETTTITAGWNNIHSRRKMTNTAFHTLAPRKRKYKFTFHRSSLPANYLSLSSCHHPRSPVKRNTTTTFKNMNFERNFSKFYSWTTFISNSLSVSCRVYKHLFLIGEVATRPERHDGVCVSFVPVVQQNDYSRLTLTLTLKNILVTEFERVGVLLGVDRSYSTACHLHIWGPGSLTTMRGGWLKITLSDESLLFGIQWDSYRSAFGRIHLED